MSECDIDDIMCQLGVMSYLQGMEKLLGTEKFKTRYPEFVGLDETVAERIKQQDLTIKEALERCGKTPPVEAFSPMLEEPAETQEEV